MLGASLPREDPDQGLYLLSRIQPKHLVQQLALPDFRAKVISVHGNTASSLYFWLRGGVEWPPFPQLRGFQVNSIVGLGKASSSSVA